MDPSPDSPPEIGIQRQMGLRRYHGKVEPGRSRGRRRGDLSPPGDAAPRAGYGLGGPRPGAVWTAVRRASGSDVTTPGRSRTPSELRYQRTSTSGSQPSLDLAEVEADAYREDDQDVVNLNIDIFVRHDTVRDDGQGEQQGTSSDGSHQDVLSLGLPFDTSLPPTDRLDAMLGVRLPRSPQKQPRIKHKPLVSLTDAEPDRKERTGHAPDGLSRILYAAIVKGNLDAVRSVYKERKVVSLDHHGNTALHLAAKVGQAVILKWLLRCAAVPVTTRNARGETCAHLAAKHGHVTCLRLIVFCGSERPLVLTAGGDRQGLTPAHLAAILGHAHVVRWLVNTFGLPVATAANNLGQTPLHFAAAKGCLKSTEALSRLGDEITNAQDEVGCTPVYYACQEGQVLTLRHLVDVVGADVSMATNEGLTPLHAAAQTGRVDIVHFLLQRSRDGAELSAQTKDGATVFHMAAANGQADTLSLFLRHVGADHASRLRDIKGSSCAHDAAENGHVDCLKLLYAAGIDMHQADEDGETPCTLAAHSSNGDCARLSEEMVKQRPVVLSTSTVTSDHDSDTDSDDDTDDDIDHLHDLDGARLMWLIQRQAAKYQRRKAEATNFVREDTMRSKEKKSLFRRLKDKFDEEKQLQEAYERNLKVLKKEFILRSKQARADKYDKHSQRHIHKPTAIKAGQSVLNPKPVRSDVPPTKDPNGAREEISLQRTDVLPEGTSRSLRRMASQVREDALSDEHHLSSLKEASSRSPVTSRPDVTTPSHPATPKITPVIQELKRTLHNSHGLKYGGYLRSAEHDVAEVGEPTQSTVTTQTYDSLEHVFMAPQNTADGAHTDLQNRAPVTSLVHNNFAADDNSHNVRRNAQTRSPEDHGVMQPNPAQGLRPVMYPGPKVPPRRAHKLKKLGDYRPLKDKVSMQFECIPEVESNSSSSFSERHSNHSSFEKHSSEPESKMETGHPSNQSLDYYTIPDYCPPPPSFRDDVEQSQKAQVENEGSKSSLDHPLPYFTNDQTADSQEQSNPMKNTQTVSASGSSVRKIDVTAGNTAANESNKRRSEESVKKIHPRINVLRNILQDSGIMTAYMDYMQGKFKESDRKSDTQDKVAAASLESTSADDAQSTDMGPSTQTGVPPAPPPPPMLPHLLNTGKTQNISNTEDDMSASPASSSQTSGYISPGMRTPPSTLAPTLTSGQTVYSVAEGQDISTTTNSHTPEAVPFQEIRHLQGGQSPWNISLRRPPPRGASSSQISELERLFKLRNEKMKLP